MSGNPPSEFERHCREHYVLLSRRARRMSGSREDAEDLLQETLATGFRRWDSYERRASVASWLTGIMSRLSLNRARRRRFQLVTMEEDHGPSDDERFRPGWDEASTYTQLREFDAFIESLPEQRQSLFRLVHVQGHTLADAAKILGVNYNTAHSRLKIAEGEVQEWSGRSSTPLLPGLAWLLRRESRLGRLGWSWLAVGLAIVGLGLGTPELHEHASLVGTAAAAGHDGDGRASAPWVANSILVTSAEFIGIVAMSRSGVAGPSTPASRGSAPRVSRRVKPSRPRPDAAPSQPSEYQLFAQARRELASGNVDEASSLLAKIEYDGPLGWYRAATEVVVLCSRGDGDGASRLALEWSRAHGSEPIEFPNDCDVEQRADRLPVVAVDTTADFDGHGLSGTAGDPGGRWWDQRVRRRDRDW
ncbi:MAG: RNA polymerase sigma factor [Myxococcales bacterium]|nr:RNA polymerase sigma factor [Myxococcales bacterium]